MVSYCFYDRVRRLLYDWKNGLTLQNLERLDFEGLDELVTSARLHFTEQQDLFSKVLASSRLLLEEIFQGYGAHLRGLARKQELKISASVDGPIFRGDVDYNSNGFVRPIVTRVGIIHVVAESTAEFNRYTRNELVKLVDSVTYSLPVNPELFPGLKVKVRTTGCFVARANLINR